MNEPSDNPLLREQKHWADLGDRAAAEFLRKEGFRLKPPNPCPYVRLTDRKGIEIGVKGTF